LYRAALSLSRQSLDYLDYVAWVIRRHRKKIGSRWRKCNPGRQAPLALVYLRKGETYSETYSEVAAGFGVSITTAWRYVEETIERPAARSSKLTTALRAAKAAGHAHLIVDGTLIPIERIASDRPFYSGKHQQHGMNIQVIATPAGDIVWTSGALPGQVHDLTAARIWGVIRELEQLGLITLADKGYQGAEHLTTPYEGKNKPESQKAANRAHAKLRGPGERANAQLKTWRILRKPDRGADRLAELDDGAEGSDPGAAAGLPAR
jgi:hypothetical protein